jgi:phosphonate transport system ATP-binding protein
MSEDVRYAIYFVPHNGSEFYRFGAGALGYDCHTGDRVRFLITGVAVSTWAQLTEAPRTYGFHATLKPPFRLQPGFQETDLQDALLRFANETLVDVRGVSKSFDRRSPILNNVSFTLKRGEMVALIGASGSGKSTLIRLLAGLVSVDRDATSGAGAISVFGRAMQQNGRVEREAKELRARVGVIFQQFNLVPRLSVLTNVCLGLLGRMPSLRGTLGRFTLDERRRAMAALDRVGIAEHALKRGSQLSGGQQQRAAIARTLVQSAELLIADEPIASLDPGSARRVMDILSDMNRRDGLTILVSLHQVEYALRYCPRTIALKVGEVVYDGLSCELTPELLCDIYGAEQSELFPDLETGAVAAPASGMDGSRRSGSPIETLHLSRVRTRPIPDRRRA